MLKGLSKEPAQRFVDVLSFARSFGRSESRCLVSKCICYSHQPYLTLKHMCPRRARIHTTKKWPVPLTPLIGREREREALRELAVRPEVRVVTLTGIGGIGKTHLALSVGNEVQEAFAQGVCFVSLAKISDPERVIPAITHALALPERDDRNPADN